MTEQKKQKPKAKASDRIAVVGITNDKTGDRFEPGDKVTGIPESDLKPLIKQGSVKIVLPKKEGN